MRQILSVLPSPIVPFYQAAIVSFPLNFAEQHRLSFGTYDEPILEYLHEVDTDQDVFFEKTVPDKEDTDD